MDSRDDNEERTLRDLATPEAESVRVARQRAQQEVIAAREALRVSNERITAILESITDCFAAVDSEWRFTYVNSQAQEMMRPLQQSRDTLLGTVLWEVLPDLVGTEVERQYRRAVAEGVTARFEFYYPPLQRWLDIRAYPARNGLAIYFQDITGRKSAEEDLREQREWFRVTLSSIGDAVITTDTAGNITFLNPAAEAITGWSSGQAVGQPIERVFQIVHEQTREPAANPVRMVLRDGRGVSLANHTVLIARDGSETAIDDSAAPIRDARGILSGAVMVFHDVTERRRAAVALQTSQARLQLAMDAGRMGDWEWRVGTGEVIWSPTLEAIHGLKSGEFGRTFEDYQRDMHPEDRERVLREIADTLVRRSDYRNEYRIVKPDGSIAWIEARGRLFVDADGNPERMAGICMDVTLRKQAEIALRESETFNRTIIESSRDCIKTLSLDGMLLWISDSGRRLLCIDRLADVIGKPWTGFWREDQRAAAKAAVHAATRGETGRFVGRFDVQGEPRWFDVVISPMLDASGKPEKLLAVSRDITERRRAQSERAWLTDVLEKSLNEIYVFDTERLRFEYVNDGALRNLGYTSEQMRELTPLDLKPDYTEASFREMVQPLLEGTEERHIFETRHLRADGSLYPVEVHLQRVMQDERPLFLAVILDITTRKEAERALRRSEEQLRAIVDSIPQLAWMAEPDGSIVWYNRCWYEYTGTTLEDMKGWGWTSVHDPRLLPQVMERWQASLSTGENFEMEFPLRGADGRYRWFLTRVNPVRDADGRIKRWFGTNTDVDEVKRAREALQDEARILELLNRTGQMLSSKLDLQVLIQTVTDTATQLSGAQFGAFFYKITNEEGDAYMLYTLSGAPREAFERLGHPRATPIFAPTFRGEAVIRCDDVMKDPRYGTMEPHRGMPAGHLPVRSYLAVPVISPSGGPIGGLFFGHSEVGVFTERTERIIVGVAAQAAVVIDNAQLYQAAQKAADERKQLLESERAARSHAERMSEVKDEFLATLSHELRTPLSAILGWAQVLQRPSSSESDIHKGLEAIERNARVQAQLIDDLLDMSRITSGKMRLDVQPVEPVSFIESAIETVRPAADAKNIRIERIIDPAAGPVHGDPNRLQQVMWNLLSNAIKFTPRGGTVKVKVSRVDSQVHIVVTDTGVGIRPEFLPHVFERFRQGDPSTTRKFGGLGLGLSIVRHLVEMHGGNVRVSSAGDNSGATFSVHLPLAAVRRSAYRKESEPTDTATALPAPYQAHNLSGVKVLVVDDEADARDLIERILIECSATVLKARAAEDALVLMEREKPDVLLSDIGMPGVDGYELLRRMRALGHDRGGRVPAIALTAFARPEDRTRALSAGFAVHVSKPVEPSELIATVARLARRTKD